MKTRIILFCSAFMLALSSFAAPANTLIIKNLKAGSLADSITARGVDPQNVESLTITGNINGNDVRVIRNMGGTNELGDTVTGYSLKALNLDSARLVRGGEYYFYYRAETGQEYYFYTQNDTISSYLFANCSNLVSVSTPLQAVFLEEEGMGAFRGCSRLRTAHLNSQTPESVIPRAMFYSCTSLDSVLISNKFVGIGRQAFMVCRALVRITLPESVEFINEAAFREADSLTAIKLPNKLKILSPGTFSGCLRLTDVQLPDSLTEIHVAAFESCNELRTPIVLSKKVNFVEKGAFYGCGSIPYFLVDADNPSYKTIDSVLYTKDGETLKQYPGGKPCAVFTVPSAVKKVESFAFMHGIAGPQKVIVPATVQEAGSALFSNNAAVKEIDFLAPVNFVELDFANSCNRLEKVVFSDSIQGIAMAAFERCFALKQVHLPRNLDSIGDAAFIWCMQLDSLYFYEHTDYIGTQIVRNSGVAKVEVAPQNRSYVSINNALYSKDTTVLHFHAPGSSDSVFAIPNVVETVFIGAFADRGGLKKVIIPPSVKEFKNGAFYACFDLQEMEFQLDSIDALPDLFAQKSRNLCKVNLPKVGSFGDCAFMTQMGFGDSLASQGENPKSNLHIYSSTYSIGKGCFHGFNIDTLFVDVIEPLPLQDFDTDQGSYSVFTDVENSVLVVPAGSRAAYIAADQWSDFGTIIERANITVKSSDAAKGAVNISNQGVIFVGDSVTITATAKNGSTFAGWIKTGSTDTIKQNPYTFRAGENVTYTALFKVATAVKKNSLNLASLEVFPNPFTDVLQVKNTEVEVSEAVLYDMQGAVILSRSVNGYEFSIHTSHLSSGSYILELRTPKGIVSRKVVKL